MGSPKVAKIPKGTPGKRLVIDDEAPTLALAPTNTPSSSAPPEGAPPPTASDTRAAALLVDGIESQTTLKERLRRAPTWAVTANNVAFMCVPRSIPACLAATGWPLGIAALTYSSVVTYDTGKVLGEVCSWRPNLSSFPELTGEAFAHWSDRLGGSPSRRERWRAAAHGLTLGLQFATYYLTAVTELIYFEQFMGQLFETSAICQWQWMLIAALIAWPFLQVPSFHESRWVALIVGVVPLVANVVVMFYEVAVVRPWDCTPGPAFGTPSAASVALGFTAFAYAYGGHGFYPEEIREMKQPSAWNTVMRWTYGIAMPLYWACGIVGYYAYGDFAMANINLNFPRNGANLFSIALQAVQEIYFVLSSNLVLLLAVEIPLGIDPSAVCTPPWRSLPPWLARLLFRSAFFGSQVLLAQMLLAGEGDTLMSLQSLIGAVGMTAFTYFLPYVLLLLLSPARVSRPRAVWAVINIIVGVLVMLGGLLSSIQELVDSSAGLFEGDCHLPYAYAPLDPDDPCFVSGLPPGAAS